MNSCKVCNGYTIETQITCLVEPYRGRSLLSIQCSDCGFISFPTNTGNYLEQLIDDPSEQKLKFLRNGNQLRPGREYHMAKMGIEIVQTSECEITFFGAGLNTDHIYIKENYPKSKTKLVDLENLQNSENFETIENATSSRVVIASEVIEHFNDPIENFESLIKLVEEDGILICSTNIYDGTDIQHHQYPFTRGHCSYWTPMAILNAASRFGFIADFRTPEIAYKRAGPRKRYILIYKSINTLLGVSYYFGTHMHAPSEIE